MSRPIVVGYDTTRSDHAPIRFGVSAARWTGARRIIVCAYATAETRHRLEAEQPDEDMVADASQALDEVRHELAAVGVRIEYHRLAGTDPARTLHEAASIAESGLLVVGSTRRRAAGRALPGSLVERLMHGAPCPIAVVPSGWEAPARIDTIGAAYIDSAEGREALRVGHALARRAGATLRVLTAVKAGVEAFGQSEALIGVQRLRDFDELEGDLRAPAEAAQRSAIAALGGDVAVEADVFVEDPAGVLIRVSEHVDLLVCGSRGYGPLRAVLLGGVSRRVATEARCPVIVLPRRADVSLEALLADLPRAEAAGDSGSPPTDDGPPVTDHLAGGRPGFVRVLGISSGRGRR
jgi:nucleotide-binding universal stress UspA family protein